MEVTIETVLKDKENIANLIKSFSEILKKEDCLSEIIELLHGISFYSEQFFINSTLLLERHELLSYAKHDIGYMEFVNNLVMFQERLTSGEISLASDLYDYVKHWFNDYVLDVEKDLTKCCK